MCSQLVQYWIAQLPITHDVEEAQLQFEFLCDFLLENPPFVLTGDLAQAAQQMAKIFGEAFQDKFFKDETD